MSDRKTSVVEEAKSRVSEIHLKAALKVDKGDSAHLTSWTFKDFTKNGDNYASIVTSVDVTYSFEGTENRTSYVVKIIPTRDLGVFNDLMVVVNRKEALFYQELVPLLNAYLKSVDEPPLRVARCYYINLEHGKEVIFLEDLRTQGFSMFDRLKGLDDAHITLILQELARLHASSLLLQHSGKQDVIDHVKEIVSKDWMNYCADACAFTDDVFQGSIDNAVSVLKEVSGYDRAVQWLQELKPRVMKALDYQLQKQEPFVALCHGDCWINNVLFRYDESEMPVEVMLVDLQAVHFASLGTELSYLMYTSLNASDRRNNVVTYLDTYYSTFRKVMEAAKVNLPFTNYQLQQEYKDKRMYGILFSLMSVPVMIGDVSSVPSVESFLTDEALAKQKDTLLDMVRNNPCLRPRFLGMFDEIMECGMIPSID